ncbi:RHS repeat-associated core domain-containing protein [Actinophytocola oryzae]|uniref:RHS repeat-associated protein n=1 Tax=Actinophytocola oryzae TaxID=502181 RepID=A0A4R7W3Q0_9PSEU|nr:RHS repeat-associated core domain-containing protein [Actinophytocola oryzae]TDV57184.1 RHS repeat-associated protein [Actinophytocola oryzae]
MTPRRRHTGAGPDGGHHDSGSGSTGRTGDGADVDPDHVDTMAGRLANTGGRVDSVGTTLDGITVGSQSMGIVGGSFTGAAQTHVQAARHHVTRTRQAVRDAEDGTRATARDYRVTEETNAANLADIDTGTDVPRTGRGTAGGGTAGGGTVPPRGPDRPGGDGDDPGGGQRSDGNGGCDGKGGDPVDVVSGQMITDAVDVELPGLLPLVLRRAYASGYEHGASFGPGWSATVDQRLELTADAVRYVGDDAQVLVYPHPGSEPVLPAAGARWPLTRDGATYRVEDPESGWVRHFAPDSTDRYRLTTLTDRNGNAITFTRDRVTHAGYVVAIDHTETQAGERVGALRLLDGSPDGIRLVQFGYDVAGRLTAIMDSTGVPYRYAYDDANRITAWVDRNGYRYDYGYDAAGRVVRAEGQDGTLTSTFAYDTENRVTTVTGAYAQVTAYHYDRHNHLTRVVDPLGNAVAMEYDRHHRLLSHTDGLGNTIRYTLDENGDPVAVDQADGTRLTVEYERRRPVRAVAADGGVWRHAYDERGNLLSVTDPAGGVIAYAYDGRGHRVARTDPLGRVERYDTDAAGLVVRVTSASGFTGTLTRDPFGRVTSVTDAVHGVTGQGWTVEGRQLWRVLPDGAREEWRYDAMGNLTEYRNPAGHATAFTYGPFGLPASRVEADGARYVFTHDHELRLTAVTNPAGLRWRYVFDAAGRLVEETDFNDRTMRYANDAANRLTERTNGAGQTVRLDRDVVGRVVRSVSDDGRTTTFAYDAAGRAVRAAAEDSVVEYAHDPVGRIVAETVDGRTVSHTYDLAGRRVRRVTPSGVVSEWTYDADGLPEVLATAGGTLSFRHDGAGREVGRTFGSGSLTQTWGPANQLVGQTILGAGGHRLQARGYRYHTDGRPSEITDQLAGTRRFDLDPAGRVTAVHAASWRETYAYDPLGNVATATYPAQDDSAQGPRDTQGTLVRRAGRVSYEYDAQGRVARTVRRTLSGLRQEWRYTWDAEDRLTGVVTPDGVVWRYRYDPLGRRVAKVRIGEDGLVAEETVFSWDGGTLAEQWTVTGGVGEAVTWDYDPGTYRAATQLRRTWENQDEIDNQFYAIVTDLVGTPSELVTLDGRIAWRRTAGLWGSGFTTGAPGVDCPLGFPGQYHDTETGLYYNLTRYYDADLAAYLSPDPLGLRPAMNPYRYVDNPLMWIDPLGLSAFTPLQLAFTRFWSPVDYGGQRVYQRDDLVEPDHVSPLDKYGRTNLKRMTQGLAPMGPDDKPVDIHHVLQTQDGPLAELTQSMHLAQGAYLGGGSHNTLHWKARTDLPSGMDRDAFEDWKKEYRRERAKGFGSCPERR